MSVTLAGQTLPDPNAYSVTVGYRGGSAVMASGATYFDVVQSTAKRQFVIGWVALTSSERSALETAWASLKTASGTLVDYDSTNYTVTRDPTLPDLRFDAIRAGGAVRWGVTVQLVEV